MSFIQEFYDKYLRKYLPPKKIKINRKTVFAGTILDIGLKDMDGYEKELIAGLDEALQPTDNVCIVGGGLGITTLYAADKASEVTTFEAGKVNYRNLRYTVKYHNLQNVLLIPKAVGKPVSIWGGEPTDHGNIKPQELPECDVLELDCEGTELEILNNMIIRPRMIIVESHGIYNSPSETVISKLNELGYDIISTNPEVSESDIVIIVGKYRD